MKITVTLDLDEDSITEAAERQLYNSLDDTEIDFLIETGMDWDATVARLADDPEFQKILASEAAGYLENTDTFDMLIDSSRDVGLNLQKIKDHWFNEYMAELIERNEAKELERQIQRESESEHQIQVAINTLKSFGYRVSKPKRK